MKPLDTIVVIMLSNCVLSAISFRWALTRAVLYTYLWGTQGESKSEGV